jgi:exonuclease III
LTFTNYIESGNINILLLPINRSREKPKKEMMELTDIINQIDLKDIYRTFHSDTKEYTFFSAPCGTFSKIDHIFRYRPSLKRYKTIEITPCILSDHRR